jgi:hypothetical protein
MKWLDLLFEEEYIYSRSERNGKDGKDDVLVSFLCVSSDIS